MRPSVSQRASQRSARAHSAEMRRLISDLHTQIASIIVDPRDSVPYQRADDLCQEIWQWSTTMGITPWRYCWDRYCSCKLMLSEWEPEALPGLGGTGASPRQDD